MDRRGELGAVVARAARYPTAPVQRSTTGPGPDDGPDGPEDATDGVGGVGGDAGAAGGLDGGVDGELGGGVDGGAGAERADTERVDVLAIETEPTLALLDGVPTGADVAAGLAVLGRRAADRGDGEGDPPEPVVAALVAGRWTVDGRPEVGDRLTARLDGAEVELEIRAAVDRLPATPIDRPVLVVDLDHLDAATISPVRVTELRIGQPAMDDEAMGALAAAESPGALTRSRTELLRATTDDPLVAWTTRGLDALVAIGLLLAVAAMAAGLGLTGPDRRRDLRLLHVLGLRRRQAQAVTAIEQLAPVVLAAAAGSALAVALLALIGPSLDLGSFVVSPTSGFGDRPVVAVPPRPDLAGLVLAGAVIVGATVAVTALAVARGWQGRAPTIVDDGEER